MYPGITESSFELMIELFHRPARVSFAYPCAVNMYALPSYSCAPHKGGRVWDVYAGSR